MALMPPLTQTFTVDAVGYLASIDDMIASTTKLAESIDGVNGSIADLAGISSTAADTDGDLSAAEMYAASAARDQALAIDALIESTRGVTAAVDEATLAIDRETTALGEQAGVADDAGASAAALGGKGKLAFLALAAGVAYAVVKAADFQEQMTRLQTQAGLTGVDMGKLGDKVLRIGDETGQTGTAIAEALYHPISAGLNLATALGLVHNAAKLAAISGSDLDTTTYALSSVMKSYNQNARDATRTSALLNSIVGQGDMKFQDFVQSVANWAPTSARMGISIHSVGAALAYLTDRGNSAESAATRLTMGLSMVTSPSQEAATFLGALGLQSGNVALKNENLATVMNHYGLTTSKVAADLKKPDGIFVALSQIKDAFHHAGLSASQANAVMSKIFGGGRSDKAILSLMQNLGGLQKKYVDIGKGVANYGADWAKTQETVSFQFHKALASVENLAISFGRMLLPAVTKVLTAVGKFFAYLQQHPLLAKVAGGILAVGIAAGVVKASIGGLAKAFEFLSGGMISDALGAIGGAITGLEGGLAVLAGGGIVAGVIALGVGLYELYRHSKAVRDIVADAGRWFAGVWHAAVHAAGDVVNWFIHGPLAYIKAEIAVFRQWWAQNGQEIERIWKVVWAVISAVAKVEIDILKGEIEVGLDVIETAWRVSWAIISNVVKTVWDVIATVVRDDIRIVLDIIDVVLDLLQGHWSAAWKALKDAAATYLNEIVSVIREVTSGFGHLLLGAGVALIDGLVKGIKSMFGAVGHAISDVAHGAVSVAKSVLGIFSPSTVFAEIGQQIGAGLIKGLEGTLAKVRDAARHLAYEVRRAFDDGLIDHAQFGSVTDYIDRDTTRLEGLAKKRDAVLKEIAGAHALAKSTTANAESFASLSNVVSALPSGTVETGGALLAGLKADLAKIRQFNDAVKRLAKLGLDKRLLRQIINAGPSDGLAMAQALLDGPISQIDALNRTESQITTASKSLGRNAAGDMYNSGKEAGHGFYKGLEDQQKHIEALMRRLAKTMVDTIRHELGISSPSKVGHWHGLMFAQGIADGIDDGGSLVSAASARLAKAARFGGGLGAGGGAHVENHFHTVIQIAAPGVFTGSEAQLAAKLAPVVQRAILQQQDRNPTQQTTRTGR